MAFHAFRTVLRHGVLVWLVADDKTDFKDSTVARYLVPLQKRYDSKGEEAIWFGGVRGHDLIAEITQVVPRVVLVKRDAADGVKIHPSVVEILTEIPISVTPLVGPTGWSVC